MEIKQCPKCGREAEVPEKKWGENTPPCPFCGAEVLWWLEEEYNVDFRVAGGTGAYRQGRKKWGGHKSL